MKILFSPVGLIAIAILAFIIFFPRRPAEKFRKFGKPMRAFPDDGPDAKSAGPANGPADGHSDPGAAPEDPKRST